LEFCVTAYLRNTHIVTSGSLLCLVMQNNMATGRNIKLVRVLFSIILNIYIKVVQEEGK